MKRLIYILFLVPLLSISQPDAGVAVFNVNFTALSEIPELNFDAVNFGNQKDKIKTFSDFNKITSQNYWVPVNMSEAIAREEALKKSNYDVSELNMKFNLEFGPQQEARDRTTRVQNQVYQEQRGLDIFADRSPFGFYVRPTRFGPNRGF